MKRSILLGILTLGLTFGTLTVGSLTAHSQDGQPRNYAEETQKFNAAVDEALAKMNAGKETQKSKEVAEGEKAEKKAK